MNKLFIYPLTSEYGKVVAQKNLGFLVSVLYIHKLYGILFHNMDFVWFDLNLAVCVHISKQNLPIDPAAGNRNDVLIDDPY